MKQVVRWVTSDGVEHADKTKAEEREALLLEIANAMRPLGPDPCDSEKGCDFSNGGGFVAHEPKTVLAVKVALVGIAARYHEWFESRLAQAQEIHPMGFAARLLDDAGPKPLERVWHRLCRIDPQGREWGQSYYAVNPGAGEQIELRKGGGK